MVLNLTIKPGPKNSNESGTKKGKFYVASDFGLIYTLNNQFMNKPEKDFSFWKRELGNKSFICCKIGASEIHEVTRICIILFISSMFYAHEGTKAWEAK